MSSLHREAGARAYPYGMGQSRIQCFMIEETDVANSKLRRYAHRSPGNACTVHPWGYHNAEAALEDVEWTEDMNWVEINGNRRRIAGTGCGFMLSNKDDPRWPTACVCGYVFKADDMWQHNIHRLYRVPQTGELVETDHAPPGAMWREWWYEDVMEWIGPDGMCLGVMTPGGQWSIDLPSKDGGRWTRTGEPPKLTVRPSILMGNNRYHGFLTDGWLEEC
jgi:hypothetical protein